MGESGNQAVGGPRSNLDELANELVANALRFSRTRESVSQPTMTGIVNRLAADNLVERRSDERDARASVITLTEAGSAELDRSRAASAASVRPALSALAPEDLHTLERAAALLGELADALARPQR